MARSGTDSLRTDPPLERWPLGLASGEWVGVGLFLSHPARLASFEVMWQTRPFSDNLRLSTHTEPWAFLMMISRGRWTRKSFQVKSWASTSDFSKLHWSYDHLPRTCLLETRMEHVTFDWKSVISCLSYTDNPELGRWLSGCMASCSRTRTCIQFPAPMERQLWC